jgi:hypothetical protein
VHDVRRMAAFCACMLGLAAAAQETAPQPLGTLFFTPEERARLDRVRRGEPTAPNAAAPAAGDPRLTGFVQRSDGRTTVWLDGRAMALPPRHAPPLDPAAVSDEAQAPVRIERHKPR